MTDVAYVLIGVFIGMVIAILYFGPRYPTVGTWHINTSDPNKDIFNIEFTRHPAIMYRTSWAVFRVVHDKNTPSNGGEKNEKN